MTEENTQNKPQRSSGHEVESNALLAKSNLRWFFRYGATISFTQGFTSKKHVAEWMWLNDDIEWTSGALFKLYNKGAGEIVNRRGKPIKF